MAKSNSSNSNLVPIFTILAVRQLSYNGRTTAYAALLPRRGPHYASHSVCPSVCLSVCLSVRPVIVAERHVAPPSELQWHTCTFRHALRAAYRTAISAAQACFNFNQHNIIILTEFEYHFACSCKVVHLCFIMSPGKMICITLELVWKSSWILTAS